MARGREGGGGKAKISENNTTCQVRKCGNPHDVATFISGSMQIIDYELMIEMCCLQRHVHL